MGSGVSKNTDIVFLYVTFPDRDVARTLGRAVVEARLAACANVFPEHESIYQWKGAVASESECAVIFKTSADHLEHLSIYLATHHPYETPCLAVLSPDQINGPFADWVRRETSAPQK